MSRVYVPATLADLAAWHASGTIASVGDGFVAPDETEEGEYAALMSAADASSALLAGPGRRIVVVVDTAVEDGPVPMSEAVAVHADLADRPADADPDDDLGWFATQEIPDLLA